MSTKSKNGTGGFIIAGILVLAAFIFVFINYIAPALDIKIPFLKRGNVNAIEYSHAEGFPKVIKVGADFPVTSQKLRAVVRTQEELVANVALININNDVKIPEINFDKKIALFVTSSVKKGGGFETRIKKITKDKDDLVIEIRESEPGKSCINTEELTLPVDLVVLDKTDLTLDFNSVKYIKECN